MPKGTALIMADTDISRRAGGLNFYLSLHLHPYFVYTSSECSGESAQSYLRGSLM